ncbi:MAG: hypothetical protein LBP25_02440 [Tannerellaceae bacterium]|nr:hypothetical protein [Tannerellaceae bacterium]
MTVYEPSTYSLPYPNPASDALTVGINPERVAQAKAALQSQSNTLTTKRTFLLTAERNTPPAEAVCGTGRRSGRRQWRDGVYSCS